MPPRYYSGSHMPHMQQDYALVDNPFATRSETGFSRSNTGFTQRSDTTGGYASRSDQGFDPNEDTHYSNYQYDEAQPAQETYADTPANPSTAHNYRDTDRSAPATYAAAKGPADFNDYDSLQKPSKKAPFLSTWSKKKKMIVFGGIAAFIVILAVAIGVGVSLGTKGSYDYEPRWNQVSNDTSFATGGATRNDVNNTQDGSGPGRDAYTFYEGGPDNFPPATTWVNFEDMWNANKPIMLQACGWLKMGKETTEEQTEYIYNAIQDRANASLVDHRLILAIVMQEVSKLVFRMSYNIS